MITTNKTFSRLAAVQILFQLDFNEKMNIEIIENITNDKIYEKYQSFKDINSKQYKNLKLDKSWFFTLVTKVFFIKNEIDIELSKNFETGWSLKRMDSTLLNILRCAYIELNQFSNIPVNVVISEYTNVAASFFNDSEVNFVNGFLDKFSSAYRKGD